MKKKYQNPTAWRHGWWQKLFKTMKLTIFILCISVFGCFAVDSYSQSLGMRIIGIL